MLCAKRLGGAAVEVVDALADLGLQADGGTSHAMLASTFRRRHLALQLVVGVAETRNTAHVAAAKLEDAAVGDLAGEKRANARVERNDAVVAGRRRTRSRLKSKRHPDVGVEAARSVHREARVARQLLREGLCGPQALLYGRVDDARLSPVLLVEGDGLELVLLAAKLEGEGLAQLVKGFACLEKVAQCVVADVLGRLGRAMASRRARASPCSARRRASP